jgi:hypothetical protein
MSRMILIDEKTLQSAMELLAVATFHSVENQKTRTDLINEGLAALAAPVQEPVAAQCKFDREVKWGWCEIAHHNLVQAEQQNWPGYQTRLLYTTPPAAAQPAPVPLTDEQIKALMPIADGTAETDKKRVEVLPGVMGYEFGEVDAWSMPLVLQIARAIEAAHSIKEKSHE